MISNPLSGRNRRCGLSRIRRVLQEHPRILHREVLTPAEAQSALDHFAAEGVNLLVVNSGDGTIQAILTLLRSGTAFREQPLLALLNGGTTNMTHQDLGLPGRPIDALRRLLNWLPQGEGKALVRRRSIMRVRTTAWPRPLYGLFFGAAGIFKGVRFFHSRIRRTGLSGDPAHLLVLGRFLWALVRRRDALAAPETVAIRPARAEVFSGDVLLVMVTTLDRLILGLRPFRGAGEGPLRLTAIGTPPWGLLSALPALFHGRRRSCAPAAGGYFGCRDRDIHLDLTGGFALDGELFPAGSHRHTIHIQDGGAADFLRL